MELPQIINKKTNFNKFSLYDFKSHFKCTYFQYGKTQIKQIVKFCEKCDPNHGDPMCEDCFENCHRECNSNEIDREDENNSDKSLNSTQIFICECGMKKHERESSQESSVPADKKCCLLDLDIKLRNKIVYCCDYCDVNVLCFICYTHCHNTPKCKLFRKKLDKYENNLNEDKITQCLCTNQNHSSIFSINTFINFLLTNGSFVYDTIPFVWKLQIVNCLFDSEVPSKLFFPVNNFFKNFSYEIIEIKKFDDLFKNIMSRVTNNIYTNLSIVFFNYHPKIIEMFPYEKLVKLLYKMKERDLIENSDLIKSILHLILYIHLKKDFQNFKNYSTFDYMVSNTLDRLTYRKFLHTESIYTEELHEKYFDKILDKFTLAEFTNFLIQLLEKSCQVYKKFGLSKCLDNYFICLKIIFFNLKRMTFDLKSLIDFIKTFEKFALIIHLKLKDIVERYKEMKVKNDHTFNWWILDKNLYRIMTVITKIIYLVTINYNDLITLDIICSNISEFKFINSNSEHSNKLFKILINTSMFYSTFIMNNEIYNKENIETNSNPTPGIKFLNTFNETLELFTVSDNLFMKRLENVDFNKFINKMNELEKSKNYSNFMTTENIVIEISDGFGKTENLNVRQLICLKNESEFIFKKIIFDLKQKVEGCIDLFFTCKISLKSLNEVVQNLIEDFGNESLEGLDFTKNDIDNEIDNNSQFISNLEEKKILKYKKKIIKKNENIFKFFNNIESHENILIKELILSNIDITLTKLFMTDIKQLNYPIETVNAIFSFLSLFALNKEGLLYFTLGRNIRRIIKIFDKYPKNTFQFICLIFKGIEIYKIDISYHKRLNEILITIRNYIKSYQVKNEEQEKEFKEFLTMTMKLLHSLKNNFNLEEMMTVQKQIFDYVDDKKLLTKEKIINSFNINPDLEREFNLDYVREIFEKEKRMNKNKLPEIKSKHLDDKLSERGENVDDYASLLPKNHEKIINLNNFEKIEKIPNSILNFNYTIYNENKPESCKDLTGLSELSEIKNKNSNDEVNFNLKFIFSFYKLMADFTHFYINEDTDNLRNIFNVINEFNDLNFFKSLLNKNFLTLRHRTSLLNFLRSIYFTEKLNSKDFSQDSKYLMNDKFYKANKLYLEYITLNINEKKNPKFKELTEKGILEKIENLNYMKIIIEIFIQELQNFVIFISLELEEVNSIKEYLDELLFSIKIISDIFITYDLPSHMTLSFYEMTKEFLKKQKTLETFINYLNEFGKIEQVDLVEKISPIVNIMENSDFEIFDTELIYSLILEGFNSLFINTNLNQNFKLETFIKNSMKNKERNFKNSCLNNKDNLNENFIHEKVKENNFIIKKYLDEFLDIYHSSFYNAIYNSSSDMDINYRQIFFDFCISYVFQMEKVSSDNIISVILTINKFLMFDTENSQMDIKGILLKNSIDEIFFKKFADRLQIGANINLATCKNFLIYKQYEEINFTTNMMIQFIQLLGEGHCKEFLSRVTTGKIESSEKKIEEHLPRKVSSITDPYGLTINLFKKHLFKDIMKVAEKEEDREEKFTPVLVVLINTLKNAIEKIDIRKDFNCEMPYDKLIVLIGNIIECFVEFLQGPNHNQFVIIYDLIKKSFPVLKNFMFYKKDLDQIEDKENNSTNYKNNENDITFKKIYKKNVNFEEFSIISPRQKIIILIKLHIINLLTALITEDSNHNAARIRNEIVSYFQPLELFEEIVNIFKEIISDFKLSKKLNENIDLENPKMSDKILKSLLELYIYDPEFQNNLKFKYSIKVFYFLKFLSEVYNNQLIMKLFDDLENRISIRNVSIIMYRLFSTILKKIEIRSEVKDGDKDFTYFIIPPICFLLTNQTMKSFILNVDRESTHTKILSLITETDYFIYEMFYNSRMMKNVSHSIITKYLYNLNLFKSEMINYGLIVIQNLLLLADFYKDPKEEFIFTVTEKHSMNTGNIIVSIIQLCFLLFILINWMNYKFFLYYRHNLMKLYNKRFIFRKKEERNSINSIESMMDSSEWKVGFWSNLKVAIFDTCLGNREVNIFIFTFILIILYFGTQNALFLVFPILFAANLNSILFGIIQAVKLRWVSITLVLFYTYLIVYCFSWVAFYYYDKSYMMEDPVNISDNTKNSENFCTNPIQCYLVNLNYGVRSGGGIADILNKISYKFNPGYFIARFFYDILFHIVVIWIMSNLFFGIIVDTFADLRDKNTRIDNDINNICFICQINRDNAMNANINFDLHVIQEHNLWNYVFFITYLHINNPNDFNYFETIVWKKIHLKDTSWIPIFNLESE